jgi:hypothetical protein
VASGSELSRGQLLAMTNLIALRVLRWSAMYGGEQHKRSQVEREIDSSRTLEMKHGPHQLSSVLARFALRKTVRFTKCHPGGWASSITIGSKPYKTTSWCVFCYSAGR